VLEKEIKQCLAQGLIPMAFVATAGTTDFGSIDPLSEIAELCRFHALWMHVDAAYGCGLLISLKFRHLLAGIEYADSVTVDYHKSFLQPVSCSAFLVKDKEHLTIVKQLADPAVNLKFAGTLKNPIATFKIKTSTSTLLKECL
jgi:L-2,4-diaminobutyrate decarboxylase